MDVTSHSRRSRTSAASFLCRRRRPTTSKRSPPRQRSPPWWPPSRWRDDATAQAKAARLARTRMALSCMPNGSSLATRTPSFLGDLASRKWVHYGIAAASSLTCNDYSLPRGIEQPSLGPSATCVQLRRHIRPRPRISCLQRIELTG